MVQRCFATAGRFGIKAEMPRFFEKAQKQMSTGDANMSRRVTKVGNL